MHRTRDGDPQRMSDRFLQDTAELAVRHSDARLVKKRAGYRRGRRAARRRPAPSSVPRIETPSGSPAALRAKAARSAARDRCGSGRRAPVVFLALQMLQVVNEQNIPASVRRRERKAGLARRQAANALFPLQQLLGHHAFAKAAGRGKNSTLPCSITCSNAALIEGLTTIFSGIPHPSPVFRLRQGVSLSF